MAYSMVCRVRISPIRITSGAWRRVLRSATSKDSVSTPTSRWVMMHPSWSWTYSIGSSTLMMWPVLWRLRYPIRAANEVDLPVPVPPTKITMPRLIIPSRAALTGRWSSSRVGMRDSIRRRTMPALIALHEGADTETPYPLEIDGELALVGVVELGALFLVHHPDRPRLRASAGVKGCYRRVG